MSDSACQILLPPEQGRDLLKQVRTQLIETARPALEALVKDITGVKRLSLHHDIIVNLPLILAG